MVTWASKEAGGGGRPRDSGQARLLRWPLGRALRCAGPPDGKLKSANVALFFLLPRPPPFLVPLCVCVCVNAAGTQGHGQNHVPHRPASDGDSFPTACGVSAATWARVSALRGRLCVPRPQGGGPGTIQPRSALCPFTQGSPLPMCACTQKTQPFSAHSPCNRKDGDTSLLSAAGISRRLNAGNMNLG